MPNREQYFCGMGAGTQAETAPFRRSRVKKLLAALIVGSWLLSGTAARAQTSAQKESTTHAISNQDMDLLRKDLRSKRKQLIAANLILTDTEAAKFWPVYDQYIAELITINDRKFGLIQEYADNWGKMTNDQSLLFTRNWLEMDIAISQLRQKYVPMVAKVLEGRKTATFFQLDRRVAMMIDLQVSSQMPLVQEQESSSQSSSRNR
jgi:outer membrane murein-binding lipoprotein Lpp